LAALTGLSPATVGLVIADLLGEGIVEESGLEESSGGRPRTILRIAAERALTVGVDVGERGLRVETFDLSWRRRSDTFVSMAVGDTPADELVARIASTVAEVVAAADLGDAPLLGVGVSVPGVVERTAAAEVFAPAFGWDGLPLRSLLASAIPGTLIVDNGAKTMGQAELWFGAGKGAQDAIVALLGIGVGAAIIADGRLYRGARSSAGEWGHTPIVIDGDPCRCGSRGCLEAYVGESAILRRWDRAAGGHQARDLADPQRIERLFAASAEDAVANAVVSDVLRYLGVGLATLVNLFNPDRIVLAGSVGLRLTTPVLADVRAATARYALRKPFESVEIVQGQLGDDAVALGAATLVVDRLLDSGFALEGIAASLGDAETTRSASTSENLEPVR
jgi:predicted NBD/HSP70 family sugar kinase